MPTSSAPDPAPRGRKSRGRVAVLLIGWALLLAWLALVGWNIATAGFPAPLSRLIALPSLGGVAPALAAQASTSLLALMIALFLVLCALTFVPAPARPAKPAPPQPPVDSAAPAAEPPAADPPPAVTPPAVTPLAVTPAPTAPAEPPAGEATPDRPEGVETGAGSRFTPRVFISHSSRDDAFGKRLEADLRAALAPGEPGRVWYDSAPERGEEDPDGASDAPDEPGGLLAGMNFPREIVDQIAARNVVVVILSPAAARSRWVKYEIDQAINRYNGPERFAIYPIIYRPCALPKPIAIFQALDFTHADEDAEDYQRQLNELVSRIAEGRIALSESAPPFDLGLLPEPPRLIGRDDDLDWALSRLRVRETTAVTALRGMGGIGKSALAAVAIRRLRQERVFPDGIAVVLCENQRDPVIVLSQALARFAPGGRQPDAHDLPGLTKAALALEGKRALIVLDNIEPGWPIEQVTQPLTEIGLTLLLTARQLLPDAVAPLAATRRLDLLAADDALLLFAQNLGRDLSALKKEEREAAEAIVTTLDRHTLAVRLAGAYAAYVTSVYQRPLARVADEIALDALGIPEGETQRKVEKTLARSIDALPDEAQRLFAALAAFATGEFGQRAALALAEGLGLSDPSANVDLLVRRALLDPSLETSLPTTADATRLRLHPLLRAEAARRLAGWDDAQREQAHRALAAWYADYTNAVDYNAGVN